MEFGVKGHGDVHLVGYLEPQSDEISDEGEDDDEIEEEDDESIEEDEYKALQTAKTNA